jgi:hypothetical protein
LTQPSRETITTLSSSDDEVVGLCNSGSSLSLSMSVRRLSIFGSP